MDLYIVEFSTPYSPTKTVREQFTAKSQRDAYKYVQDTFNKHPTITLALLRVNDNPIPIEVFRR